MLKTKNLYHLTTKKNLELIRKHGLRPMIGSNSILCGEEEERIYLCDKASLPYWAKMLALNTAIIIPVEILDENEIEEFQYSHYKEYTYTKPIDAKFINIAKIPELSVRNEKDLCLSYIQALNEICEMYADYYLNPHEKSKDEREELKVSLKCAAEATLNVVKRLNFNLLDKTEIRQELKLQAENGVFTLCDMCDYDNDNCRMYQKLNRYPKDDQTKLRHELYVFIKNTFKGCLNINTGGYIC